MSIDKDKFKVIKQCNKPETGCDYNCIDCEIPDITPEECKDCMREAEENGVEYEFNVNYKNGWWECDNCRKPL